MPGTNEPTTAPDDLEDLVELDKRRGGCCGMPAPVAVDLGEVMPAFGRTADDD